MYYTVYQTKNMVNEKTYIGVHRTKNPNDGYIGHGIYRDTDAQRMIRSGKRSMLVRAVNKYGYKNFRTEILSFFDTYEEALEEERFLVNEEWIKRSDNYNTRVGASGGGYTLTEEHLETLRDLSSKRYVVVNLETNKVYKIKNLSEFERSMGEEFGHKNDGKTISSKLNSVSRGKSQTYKGKWWACLESEWTGKPVLKDSNVTMPKREIYLVDEDGRKVQKFESVTSASKLTGADASAISKCCRGKKEKVNGMRFVYAS